MVIIRKHFNFYPRMRAALYQENEGKHNLVRDDEFRCLSNTELSRKSSLHIRQKRCQFP
jgi:hypothetical protein